MCPWRREYAFRCLYRPRSLRVPRATALSVHTPSKARGDDLRGDDHIDLLHQTPAPAEVGVARRWSWSGAGRCLQVAQLREAVARLLETLAVGVQEHVHGRAPVRVFGALFVAERARAEAPDVVVGVLHLELRSGPAPQAGWWLGGGCAVAGWWLGLGGGWEVASAGCWLGGWVGGWVLAACWLGGAAWVVAGWWVGGWAGGGWCGWVVACAGCRSALVVCLAAALPCCRSRHCSPSCSVFALRSVSKAVILRSVARPELLLLRHHLALGIRTLRRSKGPRRPTCAPCATPSGTLGSPANGRRKNRPPSESLPAGAPWSAAHSQLPWTFCLAFGW